RVAALFTASDDPTLTASIRNAYARLGSVVSANFQSSEVRRIQASAQASALHLEKELKQRDEVVLQVQSRVDELTDQQRRLQADADERATKLKDDLERTLLELSAQLQRTFERDSQLADLEKRRSNAEANHATLMDEARRLRADAEDRA